MRCVKFRWPLPHPANVENRQLTEAKLQSYSLRGAIS